MLRARPAIVLNSIVSQYIKTAKPVSSAAVLAGVDLGVSSATVRNEMATLEEAGYISRPHHAAGSVPMDKGYRYYVGSLEHIGLPVVEQMLIQHMFHQVEDAIEEWMALAGALLAQRMRNVAMITRPAAPNTMFKHMELISLQPNLALLVLVLEGARVKQQLLSLDKSMSQEELSDIANKMTERCKGKKTGEIVSKDQSLNSVEMLVIETIIRLMEAEARPEQKAPFVDGLPYLLNQPEFSQGEKLSNILSLVERKRLTKLIDAVSRSVKNVDVIIGQEHEAEDAHDFSVVMSQYGVPGEFTGTIGVIGPKRMQYSKAIALVGYLSLVMSKLVADLYGRKLPAVHYHNNQN